MPLVKVASYETYFQANITLGLLEANNIKGYLEDENILSAHPLLSQAVGGVKLFVEETDIDKSIEVIKGAEAAYLNELTCPYCHQKGLKAVEKTETPAGLLGILKNKILYGQSSIYSKYYLCKHCSSKMTELPSALDDDFETGETE